MMRDKNTSKQIENKKHHYDNGAFIYVSFFIGGEISFALINKHFIAC